MVVFNGSWWCHADHSLSLPCPWAKLLFVSSFCHYFEFSLQTQPARLSVATLFCISSVFLNILFKVIFSGLCLANNFLLEDVVAENQTFCFQHWTALSQLELDACFLCLPDVSSEAIWIPLGPAVLHCWAPLVGQFTVLALFTNQNGYIYTQIHELNSCIRKNLSAGVSANPLSALDSRRRNHRPQFTVMDCSHQLVLYWMSCLPLD